MRINYNKLELLMSDSMVKKIGSIGNSCGIMQCYMLSILFDFTFDLEYFHQFGSNGVSYFNIKEYLETKGIFTLLCPNGKHTVFYEDCDTLCENGIAVSIAGTNTHSLGKGSRWHTSLVTFENGIFSLYNSDIKQIKASSIQCLIFAFFCKIGNDKVHELVKFEKQ